MSTQKHTPLYKVRPNLTNIELETIISALRFRINTDTHWNVDLMLLEKLVMLKASNDAKHGVHGVQVSSVPDTQGTTDTQSDTTDTPDIIKKAKLLGTASLTEEEAFIEIKHRAEKGQPITAEEEEKLNNYLMKQL